MNLIKDIPLAIFKWLLVLLCALPLWVLTFIAAPFIALTAKKQTEHQFNKPLTAEHSEKYKAQGSSGYWEYWNSNVKLLRWFNNLEDGVLGEPSGKFSSSVKGKERRFLSIIRWTLRNPYNFAKRTLPLFSCKVNECNIQYVGDYQISDKEPDLGGWYFVKATHRKTKRTYFYFRWVKHLEDGYVRQASIGFKLKPEHADIFQDLDDADKSFTLRLPFKQSNR